MKIENFTALVKDPKDKEQLSFLFTDMINKDINIEDRTNIVDEIARILEKNILSSGLEAKPKKTFEWIKSKVNKMLLIVLTAASIYGCNEPNFDYKNKPQIELDSSKLEGLTLLADKTYRE